MPPASHAKSTHSPTLIAPLARQALLEWFHASRASRDMPWRRTLPPGVSRSEYRRTLGEEGHGQWAYEVMIAEVMLQQTQVATVIPYFQRWLLKYPTIRDLAKAEQEDVHALWSGLGYYSRATRLLLAAQKVVGAYSGNLPSDPQELEKHVPGVGPYTAGAISSIVYGRSVPLVDGNVQRVLCRLLGIYADPKTKAFSTAMWVAARELVEGVEEGMGGDWNEGLMELGATICKPTEAKCDECPLSSSCAAFQEASGSSISQPAEVDIEDLCTLCAAVPPEDASKGVLRYPMKAAKKKAREEHVRVTVLEWRERGREEDEGWFLVVKRPEKGLLAGLYEFPSQTLADPPPAPAPLAPPSPLLSHLAALLAGPLPVVHAYTPRGSVFHQFTHISQTAHVAHLVLYAQAADRQPKVDRGRWVTRAELEGGEVNMGTGGKKCWAAVWSAAAAATAARGRKAPTTAKKAAGGAKAGKGKTTAPPEKGQATLSSHFFAAPPRKRKPALGAPAAAADDDERKAQDTPTVSRPPAKSGVVKRRRTVVVSSDDDDDDVEVLS